MTILRWSEKSSKTKREADVTPLFDSVLFVHLSHDVAQSGRFRFVWHFRLLNLFF